KRGVEAAVALGDDHALVSLYALALAFDDGHVDDDRIARREVRDGLVESGELFLLQLGDQVHFAFSMDGRMAVGLTHSAGRPLMRAFVVTAPFVIYLTSTPHCSARSCLSRRYSARSFRSSAESARPSSRSGRR